LVLSVAVVLVALLSRRAARALSARCVSRVEGNPILVLSTGETVRLLCGVALLVAPLVLSVPVVVVLAFGGVVVVAELSVCWLCVGVGAGAPVPSCVESVRAVGVVVLLLLEDEFIDDESVVVEDDGVVVVVPIEESVVVDEDGVVVVEDDGVDIEEESVVVVEDDGVVVVVDEEDGVDIDEESVVVEDEGVVVVDDGEDVTSPVEVECEPSFETRM
jgi:hypothetical protein